MNIAFIGVGSISGVYLSNITRLFPELHIVGLCDLIFEKAERAAREYDIGRVYRDMHEAFADPSVDIILNLTRPDQHYEVSRQALERGKHVYSEKPLAATLEEGRALCALAREKGLRLGGAPDTFMGAGIMTCKKLIEDGFIGRPVAAGAFFMGRGPESWHPDPEFYYKRAGGPMMDMGPYYLTALVHLMGRVDRVMGMSAISFPQRIMTCKEHRGEVIDVDVPTHSAGLLHFECGAIGTLTTSFDVQKAELPFIEIYGEAGTLSVPDPNRFDGPVRIYRPQEGRFMDMPLLYPVGINDRGMGIAAMAHAIQTGADDFVTSARRTFHVLDIMTGIERSQQSGAAVRMERI